MTSSRIYPLRLTKRKWRIPIHVRHKCSERCSKIFIQDPNNNNPLHFILQDNPDYIDDKCPDHNKIEYGSVRLDNFDIDNPRGSIGILYNPDEIVIPDQKIQISIDFPLINTVQVVVDFGHQKITKKELLYIISVLYKHIYDEEERTSPAVEYVISKQCDGCVDKKNSEYVITFIPTNNEASLECSICYTDYTKKTASKLPCSHIFHKECIEEWLDGDNNNNTCPLCRQQVLNCNDCDGTRIKHELHESVVIPVEHRGHILNRNPTFGIFGIYAHDLEDLEVESLFYDRLEKKLHIGISC